MPSSEPRDRFRARMIEIKDPWLAALLGNGIEEVPVWSPLDMATKRHHGHEARPIGQNFNRMIGKSYSSTLHVPSCNGENDCDCSKFPWRSWCTCLRNRKIPLFPPKARLSLRLRGHPCHHSSSLGSSELVGFLGQTAH